MRPLPAWVRKKLRRIAWVYEVVRTTRARRQEQEYLCLREHYYHKAGAIFAEPGWRTKSRGLLSRRWVGPTSVRPGLTDVRVFAAATDDLGGPRIVRSLQVCCDTELFDLGKYRDLGDQERSERAAANLSKWRPQMQRDLVKAFKVAHARSPIDVAFTYGNHFDFDPETLRTISREGVPVLNLCLDDKHIFLPKRIPWPNGQKPLIGSVDVHLTNSLEVLRWYTSEAAPVFFMPQGVDTDIFRQFNVEKDMDVCFIGQRYGMRERLVEALRKAGVRVVCFGRGWGSRSISDAEKVAMYSRARINLGIGGTGVSERVMCVKGRDFEVTACGGLYLTSYNPELALLYDIGKEILCYTNEFDCVELVRYYLERPEEAKAIAAAGRARCLRDHTWERRFEDLFTWMDLVSPQGGSRG